MDYRKYLQENIKEYTPTREEDYCITHWEEYGITKTREEFLEVMINLNIFGESLEGLHEGSSVCGFLLARNEKEVIEGVLEHTAVYSFDEYIQIEKENCECSDYDNFKDYMEEELINGDCDIMQYEGKIYKRIYC